jgi:hypothetical protein
LFVKINIISRLVGRLDKFDLSGNDAPTIGTQSVLMLPAGSYIDSAMATKVTAVFLDSFPFRRSCKCFYKLLLPHQVPQGFGVNPPYKSMLARDR